jgi:polysaccharide export outer membrane protein
MRRVTRQVLQAGWCAALIAVTWLVPASVAAQTAPSTPPTRQTLIPGDFVRITVWRQPELSGDFRITADGSIAHPLYQSVDVRNVPLADVAGRLRQFLTTFTNDPQVVVEPMLGVAVGGEVRTPGLLTVPLGTTVSQAIAQAGGGAEQANLRKVRLVRGNGQQMIDLTDLRVNRGALPVESGDQIFISRRSSAFRDVIGPLASVLGAGAAIISIIRK